MKPHNKHAAASREPDLCDLGSGGDSHARVGSSYAPLGRSVAPLCINRCITHSGVWLPTEGGACLDKCCYRSLIRLGLYRGSLV